MERTRQRALNAPDTITGITGITGDIADRALLHAEVFC